jgi:hypothetical protein
MSTRYYLRGPGGYVSRDSGWTQLPEEAFYWVTSEAAHAARKRWPHHNHLTVVVRDIKTLTPYAQIAQPFRVTP